MSDFIQKALNIFNAALVTPTYYVFFTSATIITSAILFQGFNGSGVEIATVVMGFLQICSGVVLLQLSKSAKDVPDAAVFKGDLDQVREVVTQEEPETEPRADSIRGTAAIIRRISTSRRNMEEQEARRFFNEKREDCRTPPSENEVIEWDGLRRRKTVIGEGPTMSRPRTPGTPGSIKSFPPLGMSHFPTENGHVSVDGRPSSGHHFFEGIRSRASVALHPAHWRQSDKPGEVHDSHPGTMLPVGLDDLHGAKAMDTGYHGAGFEAGRERSSTAHSITWADEVQPDRSGSGENSVVSEPLPHPARRQFSFNNVLSRMRPGGESTPSSLTRPARGILRRTARSEHLPTVRASTEEERLGLVHGDSQDAQVLDDDDVNEKLERTWSSSSESSDGGTRRLVEARPRGLSHQSSASTMSTTPFPHYEEYDPYHPEDHHYVDPSSQGASHGQVDGPQPRSITGHAPRSRMATSSQSRPNPLPPVPDEDLVLAGRTEPSMRVELRSSGHSRSGSETGWRRHGRGRGS